VQSIGLPHAGLPTNESHEAGHQTLQVHYSVAKHYMVLSASFFKNCPPRGSVRVRTPPCGRQGRCSVYPRPTTTIRLHRTYHIGLHRTQPAPSTSPNPLRCDAVMRQTATAQRSAFTTAIWLAEINPQLILQDHTPTPWMVPRGRGPQ